MRNLILGLLMAVGVSGSVSAQAYCPPVTGACYCDSSTGEVHCINLPTSPPPPSPMPCVPSGGIIVCFSPTIESHVAKRD